MRINGKWIRKEEDIGTASLDDLRHSLCTCDGMGERFKSLMFDEVCRRMGSNTVKYVVLCDGELMAFETVDAAFAFQLNNPWASAAVQIPSSWDLQTLSAVARLHTTECPHA